MLEVFLRMMRNPPEIDAEESYNLSMDTWNMGDEPVTGKAYADFVEENASSWREAWQNVFGEDAVIRTDERWDGTVRHLGYNPVTISYYVKDTLSRVIPTDAKLIKASQERLREAKVIPDSELTPRQRAHLNLARAIVQDTCRYRPVSAVHAAIIPPASDRVRTAGHVRPDYPGDFYRFGPVGAGQRDGGYGDPRDCSSYFRSRRSGASP